MQDLCEAVSNLEEHRVEHNPGQQGVLLSQSYSHQSHQSDTDRYMLLVLAAKHFHDFFHTRCLVRCPATIL